MTQQARGEYAVTHLRVKPECMEQFMPLWERLLSTDDQGEQERIRADMRPLQYEVGPTETFHNMITTVGKNDMLDKYLKGAAYTQTLVMGLKGTGTAAATDTQASHPGWLEQGGTNAPTYTAPRKTVTMRPTRTSGVEHVEHRAPSPSRARARSSAASSTTAAPPPSTTPRACCSARATSPQASRWSTPTRWS